MELIKIFEHEYSKKNESTNKRILIEANTILKYDAELGLEWLPGAEEVLGLLSERDEDTEILIYNEKFADNLVNKLMRKSRIFFVTRKDPVTLSEVNIIISTKAGFNYTEFPAIKEFLKKLKE